MHSSCLTLFSLSALCLATVAQAFTYTVGVGQYQSNGGRPGVGFDPSRTTPASGDTIEFTFLQGSHRVIQSVFAAPCSAGGAFDTGLQTVANGTLTGGPSFNFTVTDASKPLYFSDIGNDNVNCLQGAVFCVNTNENDKNSSCASLQAAAIALGQSEGVSSYVQLPPTTSSTISSARSTSSSAQATSTPKSSAQHLFNFDARGWASMTVGVFVAVLGWH